MKAVNIFMYVGSSFALTCLLVLLGRCVLPPEATDYYDPIVGFVVGYFLLAPAILNELGWRHQD